MTTANVSQLSTLFQAILPNGTRLSVSADGRKLLTEGYTSHAGNTYFAAISLTNDFVIKEDLGQGWKYTFLNGLKIYTLNNQLIAERSFHCHVYSEETVAHAATDMLTDAIMEAAQRQRIQVNRIQVESEVRNRLNNTKRLK
ncbi:hypothetical protein [Rhodoflexus sp.]